jgi:ankyrin repeat protein
MCMKSLLLYSDVFSATVRQGGNTALVHASSNGHTTVVELLLQAGAKKNSRHHGVSQIFLHLYTEIKSRTQESA